MTDPLDIVDTFINADHTRRVDLCGGEDSGALIEVVKGLESLLHRDAKRVVAAGPVVAHFARDHGVVELAARSMRSTVTALAYTGEHARSIDLALEARQLAMSAGAAEEAARALVAAMHSRCETGQIDAAIEGGEIARRELLSLDRSDLAIRVDLNLGNVRKMQGEATLAIEHLERVLGAISEDDPIRPHALNAVGECWFVLDDLVRSERAFRESESLLGDHDGLAWSIVVGNRADVASREGRYQEAIDLYRTARKRCEDLELESTAARLTLESGEVLGHAGLIDEAISEIKDALDRLERLEMSFESGRACMSLGALQMRMGRFEESIVFLDRAERFFNSIDNQRMVERSQLLAVESAMRLGRLDSAEAMLNSIRGDRGLGEPSAEDVKWWFLYSQMSHRRGKAPDALGAARTMLEIALKLGLQTLIIDAETNLAENLIRMGFINDGLTTARAAAEGLDRIREGFTASRLRGAFLASRTGPYQALVAALVARGRPGDIEEAFLLAERARSRDLVERIDAGLGSMEDLDPEIEAIRRRLRALYASLDDDGLDDQRRSRIDVRQREIDRLEIDLDRRLVGRRAEVSTETAFQSMDDVRGVVPHAGAILQYFSCGDRMYAFTLVDGRASAIELPADMSAIESAVTELHFQCRRRLRGDVGPGLGSRMKAMCDGILTYLYDVLVEPLGSEIHGVSRWLVVPHGPLVAVPFHALRNEGRYVIDDIVVTSTPSLEMAQRLADMPHRGSGVLVATVSDRRAPAIQAEGDRVAEVHDSVRRLDGEEADSKRVLEALSTVEIAHIACHGRFLPGSPRSSGLRLSDRWVTIRDIRELPRTPPVVILSGCETGLHPQAGANELLGLSRSFAGGGSRSVVASLWSVHDSTSTRLMTRMHERLSNDAQVEIGEVLSEAQREIQRESPHPAFWAPFFCSEPSRLDSESM
ncbi:MAG: CHAT domain-containing protein [Phycisphaera sp.]|nr:CHAT domain-containing protein [Phycisphaera sp.]